MSGKIYDLRDESALNYLSTEKKMNFNKNKYANKSNGLCKAKTRKIDKAWDNYW